MIDRVHFENFKSLANLTLELGRFTVLVGANGCGKSSVQQAIHLLSQTGTKTDGEPHALFGRFGSIYSDGGEAHRDATPAARHGSVVP